VLLAVLIVIVVLSLAAYKYSELMSFELRATNRILKTSQVKALAESGVHYAAALLATPDSITQNVSGNPFNNQAMFYAVQLQNTDSSGSSSSSTNNSYFSICSIDYTNQNSDGSFPVVYGVTDEAGKINLNAMMQIDPSGQTLYNMLMLLPNMTDTIANSIIDWMDPDDDVRQGGAESSYYLSLTPPYECKNGPLDSIEELLLVQGVTQPLLLGNDISRNGVIDNGEDSNQQVDPGWLPYLTVYSRESNNDSTGNPRLYLNSPDLNTLYTNLQQSLNQDMATFIIAYRLYGGSAAGGGTTFTVTIGNNSGSGSSNTTSGSSATARTTTTNQQSGGGTGGGAGGGGNTQTKTGTIADLTTAAQKDLANNTSPKGKITSITSLFSSTVSITSQETTMVNGRSQQSTVTTVYNFPTQTAPINEYLSKALDSTTTQNLSEIPARININTAPQAVLTCLPGLTDTDVEQIIAQRPALNTGAAADTSYATPAWLVTEMNMSLSKFQAIEQYVTCASQVYRFQSIGYFDQGGPLYRIEAVVDSNNGSPRILYYRDLTELGNSIDPRQQQP
jgi:type II secretory pathway component PulK